MNCLKRLFNTDPTPEAIAARRKLSAAHTGELIPIDDEDEMRALRSGLQWWQSYERKWIAAHNNTVQNYMFGVETLRGLHCGWGAYRGEDPERQVSQFHCPKCGSSRFGSSSNDGGRTLVRQCHRCHSEFPGIPDSELFVMDESEKIQAAVSAERERCARIAETWRDWTVHDGWDSEEYTPEEVAAKIRSGS